MNPTGVLILIVLVVFGLVDVPKPVLSSAFSSAKPLVNEMSSSPVLTVRSLRAWNQLPQEFVPMLLAFRADGIDLLPFTESDLQDLALSIADDPSSPHYNFLPMLLSLTEHLHHATLDSREIFPNQVEVLEADKLSERRIRLPGASDIALEDAMVARWEKVCINATTLVGLSNVSGLLHHSISSSLRCSADWRDEVSLEIHFVQMEQRSDGVRRWVQYAQEIREIHRRFSESTAARAYPSPIVTWTTILNSIHFLGEGTIAPAIYRNSSGSRGYLYYRISNRDHVFVKFESDFPVSLQALSQDVMVGGEIAPWEKVLYFLAISLPLVFVVLVLTPSRVRRFLFARPRRVWAIGLALFLILVGWGAVLFLGPAIYGFSTSGLAIVFLLMVVLIAGSSQIFTNGRFRPSGLAKMAKGALFLLAPFVVLGVVELFWLIPYVGSFLQSLFAQVIGLVFFFLIGLFLGYYAQVSGGGGKLRWVVFGVAMVTLAQMGPYVAGYFSHPIKLAHAVEEEFTYREALVLHREYLAKEYGKGGLFSYAVVRQRARLESTDLGLVLADQLEGVDGLGGLIVALANVLLQAIPIMSSWLLHKNLGIVGEPGLIGIFYWWLVAMLVTYIGFRKA